MTTRALSEIERAILRAIVELGDEAYGVPVIRRADELLGRNIWTGISTGALYVTTGRLEGEGYIRAHEVENDLPGRGKRVRRYWKPCFDLTAILEKVDAETIR